MLNTFLSNNSLDKISGYKNIIGNFAKKVSIILGLGITLGGNPVLAQETAGNMGSTKSAVGSIVTSPANTGKYYKVEKGESVSSFMMKSFGVTTGWEFLVGKDGSRIKNPNTDLKAGKEYALENNQITPISKQQIRPYKLPTEKVINKPLDVGFNYKAYKESVSKQESSSGKYDINNSKAGYELGVSPLKIAHGRYGFTKQNLKDFGIETPEQISAFEKNPALQEEIMKKSTMSNLRLSEKNSIFSYLIKSGVFIYELLPIMHHKGRTGALEVAEYAITQDNPREAFFAKLKEITGDWLGKKTSDYVAEVSSRYKSLTQDYYYQVGETLKINIQTFAFTTNLGKQKQLPIPNNNDILNNRLTQPNIFNQVIGSSINFTQNNVAEIKKYFYKQEILSKISKNTKLSQAYKDKLIEELSKIDDIEFYYKNKIAKYNEMLQKSTNDLERKRVKILLSMTHQLLDDIAIKFGSEQMEKS